MSAKNTSISLSYSHGIRLPAVLLGAVLTVFMAAAPASETMQPVASPIPPVDRSILLGFLADNSTLTLIDARSPEEYTEQHLPGAINIPFDAVSTYADRLPEDMEKTVVVYCRTGKRAGLLREKLVTLGYTDVRILPRQQIHWNDNFMVFNCSTEPVTTAVQSKDP